MNSPTTTIIRVLTLLSLLFFTLTNAAKNNLISNVFGSHMTLQRDAQIPVWGWTTPDAAVSVTLGKSTLPGTADATGLWKVIFPSQPAWTVVSLTVTVPSSGASSTLNDIIFGDVIICSGQSNTEFTMNDVINATTELALANNYPFIRVTSGPLQGKLDLKLIGPQPYLELLAIDLPWSVATNETIGGVGGGGGWDFFSAACWYTLKGVADANIAAGESVPLGGIVQCYGGTSIQWWASPEALATCPPAPGSACCNYGGNSSCLYNAQIAPYTIGPTGISAFVYYQGEQNAGCGGPPQIDFYQCALTALISSWRSLFNVPNAPFGVWQLAAWSATTDSFPLLRLIQVKAAQTLSRVYSVNTLDAGQPLGGPVHSPYKKLPGGRSAAALSSLLYNRTTMPYIGPRAASASAGSNDIVTVSFTDSNAILSLDTTVSCPTTIPGEPTSVCEAFAVQTANDCIWHQSVPLGNVTATLDITGSKLILTLPSGTTNAPVAVRGYFGNWPLVQLRDNTTDLPADPFLFNNLVGAPVNVCVPPSQKLELEEWIDDGNHA
jgi:hypothetical protein